MSFHHSQSESAQFRSAEANVCWQPVKWLMAIALVFLGTVISPGEAVGQSKSDMPWYDADQGDVQPMGLRDRPAPSTANRDSVPDYVPPKSKNSSSGNSTLFNGPNLSASTAGSMMSIFVWSISIMAAVAVIVIIIWLVFVSRSDRSAGDEEDVFHQRTIEESIKQLPFELDTNQAFGDFRSLAQQLYQKGDLRRAMILLFSHVLVSMDQKGFVRLKKGKTNRQYLRELKPYRSLGSYFGQVMVRFEEAFFGDRELKKAEFEACWDGLDRFMAELDSTRVNTDV